jgi:hypothetical protein
MKKILWWSSGANIEILEKIPTEQNRYATIGLFVIITGLVAAIMGTYSFQPIFNNSSISILIGLVWGIIVFNIERILVQNLFFQEAKSLQKTLKYIICLSIVIVLSIVVTYPFILRMFSSEINQQSLIQSEDRIFKIEKNYDNIIQNLITQEEALSEGIENRRYCEK